MESLVYLDDGKPIYKLLLLDNNVDEVVLTCDVCTREF
jgi:hypothetical protein